MATKPHYTTQCSKSQPIDFPPDGDLSRIALLYVRCPIHPLFRPKFLANYDLDSNADQLPRRLWKGRLVGVYIPVIFPSLDLYADGWGSEGFDLCGSRMILVSEKVSRLIKTTAPETLAKIAYRPNEAQVIELRDEYFPEYE